MTDSAARGSADAAAVVRDQAEFEALLSRPRVEPDVTSAYGEHPDQVVDFYAPRGRREGVPLVVVVHGGAWRAPYDRAHLTPFAGFLASRGFAVANVEYRRGARRRRSARRPGPVGPSRSPGGGPRRSTTSRP